MEPHTACEAIKNRRSGESRAPCDWGPLSFLTSAQHPQQDLACPQPPSESPDLLCVHFKCLRGGGFCLYPQGIEEKMTDNYARNTCPVTVYSMWEFCSPLSVFLSVFLSVCLSTCLPPAIIPFLSSVLLFLLIRGKGGCNLTLSCPGLCV